VVIPAQFLVWQSAQLVSSAIAVVLMEQSAAGMSQTLPLIHTMHTVGQLTHYLMRCRAEVENQLFFVLM